MCTKLYKTISFHPAGGPAQDDRSLIPGHPRSKLATRLSATKALSGHVRPGHAGQAGSGLSGLAITKHCRGLLLLSNGLNAASCQNGYSGCENMWPAKNQVRCPQGRDPTHSIPSLVTFSVLIMDYFLLWLSCCFHVNTFHPEPAAWRDCSL